MQQLQCRSSIKGGWCTASAKAFISEETKVESSTNATSSSALAATGGW